MSVFVQRGERLAARKVGGEMVILSADDSSLFVLNELGTAIWEAADGQTSVRAIADRVCEDYDIDADTALRDVEAFIEGLAEAGVVSTSDEAVA
jgi:hypothetical protein